MDQTPSLAPSLPKRRSLLTASLLLLSVVFVSAGGCSNQAPGPLLESGAGGGYMGTGSVPGAGGGGPLGGGGGPAGNSGGGLVGDSGGGPAGNSGGGPGSGGAEPCEDLTPPYDPQWPDATCESWANESDPPACGEDWFKDYCDVSCGRCVPNTDGSGGAPAKPCEDVEPPPSDEWPGATCENWANETPSCSEDWFANYCDISCGRCVPEDGSGGPPMPPDCSGENLPNVTGGDGFTTRYWDCCQTHCAQQTGQRCGQDGVSSTGDQNSSCNGGGSFACYREAPYEISKCLSYGHIAKANPNCGGCYRIQFTGQGNSNPNDIGSKLIQGKQMIVKVTNTGSDVGGNQFDLMIPGGGVGRFNACSRQWNTNDLGEQYGGFLSACSTGTHAQKKECVRQHCMKVPAGDARDGCLWFVDWFQIADNPKFTSQQTSCPF